MYISSPLNWWTNFSPHFPPANPHFLLKKLLLGRAQRIQFVYGGKQKKVGRRLKHDPLTSSLRRRQTKRQSLGSSHKLSVIQFKVFSPSLSRSWFQVCINVRTNRYIVHHFRAVRTIYVIPSFSALHEGGCKSATSRDGSNFGETMHSLETCHNVPTAAFGARTNAFSRRLLEHLTMCDRTMVSSYLTPALSDYPHVHTLIVWHMCGSSQQILQPASQSSS